MDNISLREWYLHWMDSEKFQTLHVMLFFFLIKCKKIKN